MIPNSVIFLGDFSQFLEFLVLNIELKILYATKCRRSKLCKQTIPRYLYYLQGASSATEPSRHQTFPDNCEITDFFKELNIQFNISEESPQNLSSMNRFFFNLQPSKKNHYSFAVFFPILSLSTASSRSRIQNLKYLFLCLLSAVCTLKIGFYNQTHLLFTYSLKKTIQENQKNAVSILACGLEYL